ncbi:LysR family transcriptional regulator [Streptomyces sp. NBC_01808]|uniref:LysR family transcriptional regulator n=1 Tax=Streptomyces sp. NBC_01808 TaxID=2975947 RepID=UPI002DDB4A0C|nr:LysR family transcriptional regulator [Streptomyces sp. NBC_01808]WSA36288.1 LysR family transcriptional regulator [Streptomyces sp. NBC_01808]
MDLRLIEYFVAVVDHGGVTRAARELYVAQPSLSQAIRTLERQLGVTLFERTGRGLTLTRDGEAFTGPARRILAGVGHARDRVRTVRDLGGGRLEIAALAALAVEPLPALAAALRRRHPALLVGVLDCASAAEVAGKVRTGEAEAGLVELPGGDDALRCVELCTQEYAVVLPPALAAGLPDPVPEAALAELPFVVEPGGAAAGPVVVECAHRQAIWDLVRHGAGAALLPRRFAEESLDGVVVRATEPPTRRRVGLLVRPGPLSPAAAAFLRAAGGQPADAASRTNARPAGESPASS